MHQHDAEEVSKLATFGRRKVLPRVAEGVETKTDFLAVREMGFALAQGFHFAKPMPARKFRAHHARPPAGAPAMTGAPERDNLNRSQPGG